MSVDRLGGLTSMSKLTADEQSDYDPIHESFDDITRRIKGGLAARRRLTVSNGSGKKDQ